MESGEGLIAGGAVSGGDLERPGKVRRAAEELLVEVIADPPDRLADEQGRGGRVHEGGRRDTGAAQAPEPCRAAQGYATPDAHATVPDGERPPPVGRHFAAAGQVEVEAAADQAGGEAPQRHVVDQSARAAPRLPAAHRDQHRRRQPDHVHQPVDVDFERAEVKAARGWAGD